MPGKCVISAGTSKVGDLVFIKNEHEKSKARDGYNIVSAYENYAMLQKLTDRFPAKKYTIPFKCLYPTTLLCTIPTTVVHQT